MGRFEALTANQVSVPFIDVALQYADLREDISLANTANYGGKLVKPISGLNADEIKPEF